MVFWQTIFDEMVKGNFSFAILIVGVLQLVIMIINLCMIGKRRKSNEEKNN